jgi:hypothetical protein
LRQHFVREIPLFIDRLILDNKNESGDSKLAEKESLWKEKRERVYV